MAKIVFQDEQGTNLNRFVLTPVEGEENTYDITRAANITQQGTPYNKEVGDHFLQAEDGTPTQFLSCTKSGTVYALTGLTATSGKVPVMFSVTAAYAAGDTVTIDGTSYTLATRDGSALTSGAWAAGAIITGVADVDAKALTVEPSSPVGAPSLAGRTAIPAGSDLNTCKTIGSYAVGDSADAASIVNCPISVAFTLDINVPTGVGNDTHYRGQKITAFNSGVTYYRYYEGYTGAWSDWHNVADGGHAASADNASGAVAATSAGLRNAVILPYKDSTIPTGLADNTLVFRLDVASS